ncbi:hypothetical protein BIT28_23970 [Photobacterium proteolyticum]|uniref:Sulfatase-modifying factor enzyme-like domain-containing protein n=2 Tax=Photobacterium proteolyticum TaxID=1903952 RepID=A0A1Q9GBL1_9GAMM|nr:hypothetical protein BIT28_23970 [Photobacterium proteolyticum]
MPGDSPIVNITVSDFSISDTEITNAQYIEFLNSAYNNGLINVELMTATDPCGSYDEYMVVATDIAPHAGEIYLQLGETGGCTSDGHAEHIDNKSWITFTGEKFELLDDDKSDWPVNWVKWYGADAFAQYYEVALPTEAQWEYAAKAGYNYEYPTDDGTIDLSKANYNGDTPGVYNPDGHAVAVRSYAQNPFTLYDMGGNVWEWCADYYDANFYSNDAVDPVNTTPNVDNKRVRRGGSWNYHASTLASYARASDFENRGNNHFGFRVVSNYTN